LYDSDSRLRAGLSSSPTGISSWPGSDKQKHCSQEQPHFRCFLQIPKNPTQSGHPWPPNSNQAGRVITLPRITKKSTRIHCIRKTSRVPRARHGARRTNASSGEAICDENGKGRGNSPRRRGLQRILDSCCVLGMEWAYWSCRTHKAAL
jgi:hypothetical protein